MRVCLFAGMAAAAGCRHLDVDWTAGTVADLRTEIARRQPAIASLLARSAIAVDGRYAVDGESIHEGADVAVIPPVSGG